MPRALEEAGAGVEEVRLDLGWDQRELGEIWVREIAVRSAASAENLRRAGVADLFGEHARDLTREFARLLELGRTTSALEYKVDDVARTVVLDALEDLFERYDLLLTPTLAVPPFDNAPDGTTSGPAELNGKEVDPLIGWCLTYPINFTGHPAASAPAGSTRGGLPVGVQIVGRRFADAAVIAASAALERVRPWKDSYPPARRT